MASISPRQRPKMSPREYAAKIDLLRVQDCLWARMTPAEIARKMGKDKSWVSRTIKKIMEEGATVYQTPQEKELIANNLGHMESVIAKALAATEVGTSKERFTALRITLEAVAKKAAYELAIGRVQKREPERIMPQETHYNELRKHVSPNALVRIAKLLIDDEKEEEMQLRGNCEAGWTNERPGDFAIVSG